MAVSNSNSDRETIVSHIQQPDCSATKALFCGSTYSSKLCCSATSVMSLNGDLVEHYTQPWTTVTLQ